jgi:hypothetical protein
MRYLGLLFFMITCMASKGAVVNAPVPAKRDTIPADTDVAVRKNSVSAGVSYGSDALFFGRTSPITYPFTATDVIFNSKAGFFIYGSALKVLGYNPLVDEIDLGGGYYYRLSPRLNGNISYTRFIFNKQANIIKSASSNDINLKNTYDWSWFKTSLIGDYLFGKSHDVFATITNSKYIESKFSIFDDNDYLSITPTVNVIFGTQNFVQRYSLDHGDKLDIDNIFLYNPNGKFARANARFNLLNYSFKLPVAYNRPHYTLEASYKYSIPVNVEGALRNRRESFFNFTFYYLFY